MIAITIGLLVYFAIGFCVAIVVSMCDPYIRNTGLLIPTFIFWPAVVMIFIMLTISNAASVVGDKISLSVKKRLNRDCADLEEWK